MPIKQQIAIMLARFGNAAEILQSDGQRVAVRAFVQPLRYKNKLYLESAIGVFGEEEDGAYLYIGPPEPQLDRMGHDCRISYDGQVYRISRSEQIVVGDVPLYCWAVIRPQYAHGDREESI